MGYFPAFGLLLNKNAPESRRSAHKKTPHSQGAGRISRVFAKSAIKQPSRLRRPWQMLPDRRRRDKTVRLYIGQGISGIASLSPPRLVNTSRSGSPWPCRPARIQSKSAPPCYRRSAISRVFAKSAIKQPSRLRRPWRMLPDRRRPCPREPCGSSGYWPWKACK